MQMRAILGLAFGLLAAVVPTASADMATSLQAMPSCAAACLVDGVMNSICKTDMTPDCVCNNKPLQEDITKCIKAACTVKESLLAKNLTTTECGVEPHNRAAGYEAVSIVLAVFSCGMVVLRLGFKLLVTRSLSADDYAVAVLVAFAIPCIAIIHVGSIPNGVGQDIWTLEPEKITKFLFYFYLMAVFYFAEVSLVKLCILLFYLRIFPGQNVRRLLWGTLAFNVVWGVVYFIIAIFQCQPISFFWTHWDGEHEGHCINSNAFAWSNAAISIVLDFWMLAIPLIQVKSLNLNWKKKIGVTFMFVVGTFVTVVSVIRLQSLVVFASSDNATSDNFPVSLWSTVEINAGLICTCMPTMRLILVRLFPRIAGGSSYGNMRGYYARTGNAAVTAVGGTAAGMSDIHGTRPGQGGSASRMSRFSARQQRRSGPLGNLTLTTQNGIDEDDQQTVVATSTHSMDSVAAAKATTTTTSMGIVRHQTFAVQFEDNISHDGDRNDTDEENLVEMQGFSGRPKSGRPKSGGF
ncbi:hypothetical protein VTI28DRAFT_1736 [Corynascus sepedonium]